MVKHFSSKIDSILTSIEFFGSKKSSRLKSSDLVDILHLCKNLTLFGENRFLIMTTNSKVGSDFWLVSFINSDPTKNFKNIKGKLKEMANVFEFHLPTFIVGTLDNLVGLSDELHRHDVYIEGILKKIVVFMYEVFEEKIDVMLEQLIITESNLKMDEYVKSFEWNRSRYDIKNNLRKLVEMLLNQTSKAENIHKEKVLKHHQIKNQLNIEKRKTSGSLLTKSLYTVVNKDDFVQQSQFLITLIIVVPKTLRKQWEDNYENFSTMVVPCSSKIIAEDNENYLATATVFRKFVSEFKEKARKCRFIVRDFEFDENEMHIQKMALHNLEGEFSRLVGPLKNWLKVNFSEVFTAWVHLKTIRLFVESVLRYGLPVQYGFLLIEPFKKSNHKLKETLSMLLSSTDGKIMENQNFNLMNHLKDQPKSNDLDQIIFENNEICPYAFINLKTSFLD